MNRINSVIDTGYSRSFQYDPYGNLWVTGNSGVPLAGNTPTANVYTSANRIGGGSYDAAGNQTVVNGNTLAYDAENRLGSATDGVTHAVATYLYDGDGKRVEKSGPGTATIYVYDALGQVAAEYATATATSPCTTCYLVWDHLGSARLTTDQNAAIVARHDYLPFGEEIPANTAGRSGQFGPGNDNINQKFTAKERDTESGLDYFGTRYYGSALGRFTSPDPLMATPERLLDPQEWNMYAYVRNNPLSNTDPTGLDIWLQGCGKDSSTCQGNYVGTTDKDGNFTRTHLTGDQTANATIGENGISVTQDGKTYQGVWDRNPGEQGAVLVSGAGDLKSFNANLTGACQNTCVASGFLQNKNGTPATAEGLRNALQGKSEWFANNNDPFHRHDGKNDTSFNADPQGPAGQRSTDVTVPQRGNSLDSRFHVNSGYPFQDAYQMTRHVISIMHTFTNAIGVTQPTTQ